MIYELMGMIPCLCPMNSFAVPEIGKERMSSRFSWCLSDESSHDVRFLIVMN
jgi:hypothetical protein